MKKRLFITVVAIWAIGIVGFFAYLGAGALQQTPATGNEDLRIQRLIVQLGDADSRRRAEATEELKKIGKPALQRLEQATECRDEQVRAQVKAVIGLISGGAQLAKAEAGETAPGESKPVPAGGKPEDNEEAPPAPAPAPVPEQPAPPPMAGLGGGGMPGLGGLGGGGGGMPGLGGLGGGMPGLGGLGGGMPGLGGLGGMMGGRGGLGGLGGLGGGMMGGLMQVMMQRMMQGRLGGGNPQTARPPDPEALSELTLDLRESFGARLSSANDGFRVVDVRADTPAYKAGLKVGDLITAINGRQLAGADELRATLGKAEEGSTVQVDVTRKGEQLTLMVHY